MYDNEIYLVNGKNDYKYPSFGMKMENNITVPDIKVLDDVGTDKFEAYDIFHLININKATKNKTNLEKYLGKNYEKYNMLVTLYTEQLPTCNKELYSKYETQEFNADCIIIPETSSDWLRNGLLTLFESNLNIPSYMAMKNKNIEMSSLSKDDKEFEFTIKEDIASYKNILILDDCKDSGRTINHIKNCFNQDVEFLEIFYCRF